MSSSRERFCFGRKFAFAAAHQAAILGDFVEPDQKRAGAFEFRQVWERFHEDFLHGVLGVFALATDFHAKGENRALQQLQSLLEGLRVVFLQQSHGLFDLFSHCTLTIPHVPLLRPVTADKPLIEQLLDGICVRGVPSNQAMRF